tara:strand:- start:35 stop:907 length:873 start_codon:yes stop_codon:yes gene_type:complete
MTDYKSVCLYHNGNSRVVELYKEKYKHLDFAGNYACNELRDNALYEICIADASNKLLLDMKYHGVRIIRHISTSKDDSAHKMDELEHVVYPDLILNNLCFSDEIHCDYVLDSDNVDETVIITTGRTANSNLVDNLKQKGQIAWEDEKIINSRLCNSKHAILLWRCDVWEVCTSIAISYSNGFLHNTDITPRPVFDTSFNIDMDWIDVTFWNNCRLTLDRALYYHVLMQKPVKCMTTEEMLPTTPSRFKKINYNKQQLILNYTQAHKHFIDTKFDKNIIMLYNNTKRLLND